MHMKEFGAMPKNLANLMHVTRAWFLVPSASVEPLLLQNCAMKLPGQNLMAQHHADPPGWSRTATLAACVLYFLALGALFSPATAKPPQNGQSYSEEGQRIFRQSRAAVVQIRTLMADSNTQQGVGSGFVVSADGLIITNHHVIRSWISHPHQYRLEYATDDGDHGPLTVLAIDLRHDVALLSRPGHNLPFLPLSTAHPEKGETVYTIGNPRDIGLTLVEGTYNGLRDHSLYDDIHFTGALNPGMSGGPALDRQGRVFGVNRALFVNSQLISFLVPIEHARSLLARRPGKAPEHAEILAEVARQVRAHGEYLLETVGGAPLPFIEALGYRLPYGFSPKVRCTGMAPLDDGSFYRRSFRTCYLPGDVALTDRISTGSFQVRYALDEMGELDAFRLARFRQWNHRIGESADTFPYGELTRYECQTSVVATGGMPLRVMTCLRGYRQLPGIYDVVLRIASQTGRTAEFSMLMTLTGVPYEPAMAFVRRCLEAIQWVG